MDRRRRLLRRAARRRGRGVGRGQRRLRRRGAARAPSGSESGQAAPSPRPYPRCPHHPRDRHPRRLQHHLAEHCADVAAANIARAGLDEVVDIRRGRAVDLLPELKDQAPFDLVFIDADKPSNPEYLKWALELTRPGSVIIGDNVVRDGAVVDPDSADPRVQGVRRFTELIAEHPRLTATALQTVGSKGYDGLVLALVTA